MKLKTVLVVILLISLFSSHSIFNMPVKAADSGWWYDANWDYCKKITINHTKVNATLTNFPILVQITSDSDLVTKAQSDGDDILFTGDTTGVSVNETKYNHEIESWVNDGTYVNASIWVNITSLSSSTNTDIWMYYGNASASSEQNITGTWNSGFQMVQHLNETSGSLLDSTSNNNDCTNNNATFNSSSLISGSYDFNSSYQWITTPYGNGVDPNSVPQTYSLWVKTNNNAINQMFLSTTYTGDTRNYFGIKDAQWEMGMYNDGWGEGATAVGEVWTYITIVYDGSYANMYVNATYDHRKTYNSFVFQSDFDIGRFPGSPGTYDFSGTIDEVRFSNVDRNVSWINTTYNTINEPTEFLSFGNEVSYGGIWENSIPVNSNPYPDNGETVVIFDLPYLSITVSDTDDANQTMNVSFWTNASGIWKLADENLTVNNGTYYCLNTSWITDSFTTYYWSVNTSDSSSTSAWDNDTYHFITGSGWNYSQSLSWKIINSTDYTILKLSSSGNLAIAGELYENTNSPPPGNTVVFQMNNTLWLTENGDLYLKDELFQYI